MVLNLTKQQENNSTAKPILIDESPPTSKRRLNPQPSVETLASTAFPNSSPSEKASNKSSPTTVGVSPLTNCTAGGNPWEPVDNGPRKKAINSEINRRVQKSLPLFAPATEYRIQLTNVPYFAFGFDEDAIRNFCACFGPVSHVQADVSNTGIAYVTFTKRWAALDLIRGLNGRVILDHCTVPLQVTWAPEFYQDPASQNEVDKGMEVEAAENEQRPANYNFEPTCDLWGFSMIQTPVEIQLAKQKEKQAPVQSPILSASGPPQRKMSLQENEPAGSPSGSASFPKAPVPPVPPKMTGTTGVLNAPGAPPPPAGKPPFKRSTTSQGVTFVNPYEITQLPDLTDRAPKEPGDKLELRLPSYIAKDVAIQVSRFSMRDGSGTHVVQPPLPAALDTAPAYAPLAWGQGSNHPTPNSGPSPLGMPQGSAWQGNPG